MMMVFLTAVLLLASGKVELPAEGSREAGREIHVASWQLRQGNGGRNLFSARLCVRGASYHLGISGDAYREYMMLCRDQGGAFYVWNPAAKVWETAPAERLAAFRGIGSGQPLSSYRMTGTDQRFSTLGFEAEVEFKTIGFGAFPRLQGLVDSLDASLIPAPLPGGSGIVSAGTKLDMILVLYRGGNPLGDVIRFSRSPSWFAGEAALFGSPALGGVPYRKKALSLLREFFRARGFETEFRDMMRQSWYPNYTDDALKKEIELFDSISPEIKRDLITKLSTAVNTVLSSQLADGGNGRKLFGSGPVPAGRPFLYGTDRNIYIDAWLLFCFLRNTDPFGSRTGSSRFSLRPISREEGTGLARAGMRYFTWGVEYSPSRGGPFFFQGRSFSRAVLDDPEFWKKTPLGLAGFPAVSASRSGAAAPDPNLFNAARLISLLSLDSPFEGGHSGYPLPYAENGMDSPAGFAEKMLAPRRGGTSAGRNGGTAARRNPPSDAGVDGQGFLSGSIAMTGVLDGILPAPGSPENGRRIGIEELERFSAVIPDLSLVRPGDLLLRYRQNRQGAWAADVAVVAGFREENSTPAFGADQRDFMKNILVIYPRRDAGQVILAPWCGTDRSGSFDALPENFHARRLLRPNGNGGGAADIGAVFQPASFEANIRGMEEQDRIPAEPGLTIRERWMPNTGEFLVLTDIRIRVENAGSMSLLREDMDDREIIVSGAKDRYYSKGGQTAGGANLYRNSAGSEFEIALVSMTKRHWLPLGVLTGNGGGNYVMASPQNTVVSVLYDSEGRNRFAGENRFAMNRLWIDGEGRLMGYYGGSVYWLGIRPRYRNSARPGDDLLLEFAVRERGKSEPALYTDSGEEKRMLLPVLNESYIAVYDKKVLWRANLYIDTGFGDWNDVHPWNAPQVEWAATQDSWESSIRNPRWWTPAWEYNDWNLRYVRGRAGGQVESILPWTLFDPAAKAQETRHYRSVAYGWGSWDPVRRFNEELGEQQRQIEAMRGTGPGENPELRRLQWYRNSMAPGDNWHNYIFPRQFTGLTVTADAGNHRFYQDGSGVSVPGLSTYWDQQQPSQYNFSQVGWTSGTDCSGLVHRVARYPGSSYALAQAGSKTGTTALADPNAGGTFIFRGTDWTINDSGSITSAAQRELISAAVPGDILVSAGMHAVLIQGINHDAGGNISGTGQVNIIHAAQGAGGTETWCVRIDPWTALGTDRNKYRFGRYR